VAHEALQKAFNEQSLILKSVTDEAEGWRQLSLLKDSLAKSVSSQNNRTLFQVIVISSGIALAVGTILGIVLTSLITK